MFPKKLHSRVICDIDNPVVDTASGKLRGEITDGTYIFRGIPYARAKRFHMPEKVEPWDGVMNALAFKPVCPEENTTVPDDQFYTPHFYNMQSEDCQYLNIWTQSIDPDARRPVMVWIHGGLFDTGSAVEIFSYDGEELSAFGNVVVVSVSHRLNILGFLDLSSYGEEYRYSGNAGMVDLIAALHWIKENITSFGGDPDNITLFGQSGGGQKCAALLQTPSADGFYNRIIIESGMSAIGHRPGYGRMTDERGAPCNHNDQEDARLLASYVLEELGIAPEEASKIENVYYYELARAGIRAKERCRDEGLIISWCPTFDDDYYKGDAMQTGFRIETADIPIIIGSNYGEFSGDATHSFRDTPRAQWDSSFVEDLLKERYGDDEAKLCAAFKEAYPERPLADLLFVDSEFRKGVQDFARLRYETCPGPVYTYLFGLEMPYRGGTVPWHNCEEAYVFHNAQYMEAAYIPEISEKMQDMMAGAWISFAYTSDPSHPGLPVKWERYTDRHEIMIFDRNTEMRYGHDDRLMELIPDRRMGPPGGPQKRSGGGPRLTF